MSRRGKSKHKQRHRERATAPVTESATMDPVENTSQPAEKVKHAEPWSRDNKIQAFIAFFGVLLLFLNAWLWVSQQSNFRSERRSWVGAIEGKLTNPVAVGAIPYFVISLKNTGPTPALEFTNRQAAGLRAASDAFAPVLGQELPRAFPNTEPSKSVIYPGMTVPVIAQTSEPLSEVHLARMKTGDQILYAYGRISYQDVFGSTHTSEFCLRVLPNLTEVSWCQSHNTAN
jgi:hypothetical protein